MRLKMSDKILAINPGSTSTKVALYAGGQQIAEETIRHTMQEINRYEKVTDQKNFRKELIEEFLRNKATSPSELTAVVGRGGLLKPIPGGTYLVNEMMLDDLENERYNTHASNLGAILANEIAKENQIKAYIVDPVVVDEFEPLARISGLAGIERRSVGHALNQKAVAREVVESAGKTYETCNVIVAHLGGGISIAAHQHGKMVDMVNGLDGEGPYSPERTGGLPLVDFAKRLIDESLTLSEVKKILAGNGGLKSYLNETDIRVVEERIQAGDQEAAYYLQGMCYQVAQQIGLMAVVLKGKVDFIILTGGICYSDYVTSLIEQYVDWIATVRVVPGEKEMDALYHGVRRVLEGTEVAKQYSEIE